MAVTVSARMFTSTYYARGTRRYSQRFAAAGTLRCCKSYAHMTIAAILAFIWTVDMTILMILIVSEVCRAFCSAPCHCGETIATRVWT